MTPTKIRPLDLAVFDDLRKHIEQVRRCFDWPGIPLHDANDPEDRRFNRWQWHNLPLLQTLHHQPEMIQLVSDLAKERLKPSYVFLSMYAPNGVCPKHTDRPQCQFTLDLVVRQDGVWPIYVDDEAFNLAEGEALFYSGTGQPHYRRPMHEDSNATFCDLAFFHFVPINWQGPVG